MRITRRAFLETSGAAVTALGLGIIGMNALGGRVFFDEDRALPGMHLKLTLEINDPESSRVFIAARSEGNERILDEYRGSSTLEIEVPAIETDEESYELYAVVESGFGQIASEPVEILSQPYHFGM